MDFNSFFGRFFHSDSTSRSPIFDADQRNGETDKIFLSDDFESFDSHMNVFNQMEDMFNKMFSSSFSMLGFPKFSEDFEEQQSPRSIMLKDSNQKIQDSFSVKEELGGLDLLPYKEGKKEFFEKPRSFSYSKFSSIRTVHLPDGTVEECRTVINNDGEKTTTVRRTIGDTSHEVITKSDKQGLKEKEENFNNMDENELSKFEQIWKTDLVEPSVPAIGLSTTTPSYWYLFKNFFGSVQKDEVKWC